MKGNATRTPDPFAPHKAARERLAAELAAYRDTLAPQLEAIRKKKAEVTAQAEATVDLDKLDALSIRIRSLEIREHALVGPCGPATVLSAPFGPVSPIGPWVPCGPVGPGTIESARDVHRLEPARARPWPRRGVE
jgi:hypothetical protein